MWPMDCTETISWRLLLRWQGSKSHSCRTTRNFSFCNIHPEKPVEFFYFKNSAPSTFKPLSEMQGDTTTHPEAYLDLGNEFSWAALKSRPSALGLRGICSGKSTEFCLPHRLFLLQSKRREKQKRKLSERNVFIATVTHNIFLQLTKIRRNREISHQDSLLPGAVTSSSGIMPHAKEMCRERAFGRHYQSCQIH